MIHKRRSFEIFVYSFGFSALLAIVSVLVYTGSKSIEVPENAHPKRYGSGWECDRGHRELEGLCPPIQVPENAYATNVPYGTGWECRRGYRKIDKTCVAIKVPVNGYLNTSGDGWKCNRGYRAFDKTCVEVKVPKFGYLDDSSYGRGWKCIRGYRAIGKSCVPVTLPENAHLDSSGKDWDCDRPYRRYQDECERR